MNANKFFEAAFLGDLPEIGNFVKEGGDPNLIHDPGGHTALQAACQENQVEAISVLLKLGADPNLVFTRRDIGGRVIEKDATAIASVCSVEAARLMLEAGAEINRTDGAGYSPLARVAMRRNLELVDYLCKEGAEYKKPLHIGKRSLTIVDLMDEHISETKKIIGNNLSGQQEKYFSEFEAVKARLSS